MDEPARGFDKSHAAVLRLLVIHRLIAPRHAVPKDGLANNILAYPPRISVDRYAQARRPGPDHTGCLVERLEPHLAVIPVAKGARDRPAHAAPLRAFAAGEIVAIAADGVEELDWAWEDVAAVQDVVDSIGCARDYHQPGRRH